MCNFIFLKEHMLSMCSVFQLISESSSTSTPILERNADSHAKRMSEWINWLQQMQILFVLCLQFV